MKAFFFFLLEYLVHVLEQAKVFNRLLHDKVQQIHTATRLTCKNVNVALLQPSSCINGDREFTHIWNHNADIPLSDMPFSGIPPFAVVLLYSNHLS